ncbi:type III PLP-dependent enzyme [Piscirickettsia salmonis]|uniref:type III PLP-dependent enzyme n=1 Tax=Piscirickettsia salmonis TaxID=1238 RepID=UPI0006BC6529|nr:type III PLP-dependent enzyme [Piscirickettsia salmonis]ALA25114.1 pyridoxal-dependent decarboxylase, pyridoxal binding domain protein [Piscirickettsia salmonis]APS45391.1 diaminopimelate decarboxylase [Piscirickettsia salmonis]APS48752.1 diaminopimelate decarboxylase [Piscirickettsia salmonis]QGO80451.1 L-glutamyl-[BtrI acyl-carrier protein] decarboxylase [Piscirickettsia salmonis]QGP22323.1 L-glutamyl-[BtrI acyl-carrier protein] decarboxylase [Piscirickettsia salmonis]
MNNDNYIKNFNFNLIYKFIKKIKTEKTINNDHSPFCAYIYDLDELKRHSQDIIHALPKSCQMFYATKANSELPILKTLADHLHGFEVASLGELELIQQYFPHHPIIFGGPGKTNDELNACLNNQQVELIHVESIFELERLYYLCQTNKQPCNILLRLNIEPASLPKTKLTMGGSPTPFGMDENMLMSCLNFIHQQDLIHLKGIHLHLASLQICENIHLSLINDYLDYFKQLQQRHQLTLNHLNVGGGIGINYQDSHHKFNWHSFCAKLDEIINSKKLVNTIIRFECGRYISVFCGYYAIEVIDIKKTHEQNFIICRGGTHHFRTPYAQGHSHPFTVLPIDSWPYPYKRPELKQATANIVGQLCTPKDKLAYDADIHHIRVGDIIVFSHAGAYAWNISHHSFLRHPKPEIHFIQG